MYIISIVNRLGIKNRFAMSVKIPGVSTGEAVAGRSGMLCASAIGSCIAVALYDPVSRIGGIAHLMLPGSAPQKQNVERTRYVDNGIRELLETMVRSGARRERVEACFAGGGNVLEREDETICDANVASTIRTLEQLRIPTKAQDVGGTQRRSMTLDIDAGCVSTTVGDAAPSPLWSFGDRDDKRG